MGFNLFYDSTGGYRYTPWQWVDARDAWITYTVGLADASMANTWGWDFAIGAAGNRSEDLVVRSVTVRKRAPQSPNPEGSPLVSGEPKGSIRRASGGRGSRCEDTRLASC